MLARWSYISTSRLDSIDTEERIRDIVAVSIPRNRSLQVTGSLLFTGRRFAQYIEGTSAAIEELKASILRDSRHEDVRTIAWGEYAHRRFVTWSLAYAGPSHFVSDIVERALNDTLERGDEGIETLIQTMSEFSIHGRS
ncbi:BLUF domain protein [Sphingobium chlorophenolicum L-1]|uniref:BLUF domain protein n=1 Tax=Sphingobium chlorophenolicum L-1 TaxID=690566 RepID=F6ETZ8_SPHCR|nr:BLUF domain-containing protein [Sphingobium chlorophenolicum]AEG47805.1 BLUF domain protein [Sphingobium chlorophenolicum L-1]